MRGFAAAVVTGCGLLLAAASPVKAVGTLHAFCLQGDEWPGLSNCRFDSYAQCQASASGRPLTCIANPYFSGASEDPYAYPNRPRTLVPPPPGYPPGYSWR